MKEGDLVFDCGNGMNGIIVECLGLELGRLTVWKILYEDGTMDEVMDNEIEVINETE